MNAITFGQFRLRVAVGLPQDADLWSFPVKDCDEYLIRRFLMDRTVNLGCSCTFFASYGLSYKELVLDPLRLCRAFDESLTKASLPRCMLVLQISANRYKVWYCGYVVGITPNYRSNFTGTLLSFIIQAKGILANLNKNPLYDFRYQSKNYLNNLSNVSKLHGQMRTQLLRAFRKQWNIGTKFDPAKIIGLAKIDKDMDIATMLCRVNSIINDTLSKAENKDVINGHLPDLLKYIKSNWCVSKQIFKAASTNSNAPASGLVQQLCSTYILSLCQTSVWAAILQAISSVGLLSIVPSFELPDLQGSSDVYSPDLRYSIVPSFPVIENSTPIIPYNDIINMRMQLSGLDRMRIPDTLSMSFDMAVTWNALKDKSVREPKLNCLGTYTIPESRNNLNLKVKYVKAPQWFYVAQPSGLVTRKSMDEKAAIRNEYTKLIYYKSFASGKSITCLLIPLSYYTTKFSDLLGSPIKIHATRSLMTYGDLDGYLGLPYWGLLASYSISYSSGVVSSTGQQSPSQFVFSIALSDVMSKNTSSLFYKKGVGNVIYTANNQ